MRFTADCYRAHDPKWAFNPLSGDGAAIRGARFNQKGLPALYLGLTIDGVFNEIAQGFARRFDPLTVCIYSVDMADVVDIRDFTGQAAAGVTLADMASPWAHDLAVGRRPASWDVAEKIRATGAAGILVPSFANGAKADHANLVLWRWGPNLPHRVTVHDPSGRLPKNQLSWT